MSHQPHPSVPANGEQSYPSRRSLREQADAGPETTTNSIRLPLIEHVPASSPAAPAPRAQKAGLRRRIASAFAAASVCGLVLTLSLPMFAPATTAAPDAAGGVMESQELFSETSLADLPAAVAEISATASDEPIEVGYSFDADRIVNYPFTSEVMLTDGFGYRTAPVEQFHDAQDFAAAAGTPIYAIADGTVVEAGPATDGCGFGLKLEHEIDGQTVTSRYCHMEDASHSYAVGDALEMGDPVGTVGNTGMSFGPHLHLAIRVDDEPVDPMPFFAKYARAPRTA